MREREDARQDIEKLPAFDPLLSLVSATHSAFLEDCFFFKKNLSFQDPRENGRCGDKRGKYAIHT